VIKGGIRVLSQNEQGDVRLARTRAVNAIDRDAKLNKELMSLALKFKELKGA
jgi:stress-induced morphogen